MTNRLRVRLSASLYKFLAVLAVIITAAALILHVPTLQDRTSRTRERVEILYLASQGEISGLSFQEARSVVRLRSPYNLQLIALSRNAYHSITNPYVSPRDISAGDVIFQSNCASCHGSDARGGAFAPSLVDRASLRFGDSDWELYQTIRSGISGTAMPPHPWTEKRIWQTIAYLGSVSIQGADEAQSEMANRVTAVAYQELEKTQNPTKDWLTYSGSYSGTRHSELMQITGENVHRLAPRWIFQFPRETYDIEDSPLEDHGIVFANAPDSVVALDASTGKMLWEFDRKLPPPVRACCGVHSRGLAMLGVRLYFATYDARLIALSAATGAKLWDVPIADYSKGYSITGAPLAYRHFVVTGVGGGEYPMRGFIAAYDSATGKQLWRFWTVPAPRQPGSETWPANDAWQEGGGGTWMTGTYDPDSDVLYWGVGNPNPDFDSSTRQGDDLYTDSIVALSGTTGKLLWHFQFIPDDDHDYDAVEIPELVDRPGPSGSKELLVAERNGFFYALDRTDGRFLFGKPFVRQTWAKGLAESGRPIPNPQATPSQGGTVVYPGNVGATNWWSASYDPRLDLFFVPAISAGSIFFRSAPGIEEMSPSPYRRDQPYSSVIAINAADGSTAWRYRREVTYDHEWHRGGILSTAGGVLFTSQGSEFYALDSRTGQLLWRFPTGADIVASPTSYEIDGQQYIMVASGNCLIAFALVDDVSGSKSGKDATTRPHAIDRRNRRIVRRSDSSGERP